ncbi:histidinol-phosphate aminotransferase [bacterium A37T11]|nr:histidinol-phosphate aminotransferase [bacterium A37T11]
MNTIRKTIGLALIGALAIAAAQAQTISLPKRPILLSLNENAYGPAPAVRQAITAQFENLSRYTRNEGDVLIADIAKKEGVSADQVITGEILELLGVYLGIEAGPGSEFIYSVPGYPALVNAAARVGGKIVEIPLDAQLENDLPALEAAITPKTKAVYLVNPHNPSGTVSDKEGFKAFLHRISSKALVIVDEAYLEFTDDFEGRSAINNTRAGDNVIVFRTFAKAYGLAGLSIGYAIAPTPVAKLLKKQGLGSPHDLNRLAVVAADAALKDTVYLKNTAEQIILERKKWDQVLDGLGLKHTTSQSNFIYFDAKIPSEEVISKLKEQGIVVGKVFEPYHTWVRITVGLPTENERVQKALRDLNDHKFFSRP